MHLTCTIPALPVRDCVTAAVFYRDRLGFTIRHQEPGSVIAVRDVAEIHLWEASDTAWTDRADLGQRPVLSGAESFLAGTASCRIAVDDVDALYAEMRDAQVLHQRDPGGPVDTWWGSREFHVGDLDGNLLTFSRAD